MYTKFFPPIWPSSTNDKKKFFFFALNWINFFVRFFLIHFCTKKVFVERIKIVEMRVILINKTGLWSVIWLNNKFGLTIKLSNVTNASRAIISPIGHIPPLPKSWNRISLLFRTGGWLDWTRIRLTQPISGSLNWGLTELGNWWDYIHAGQDKSAGFIAQISCEAMIHFIPSIAILCHLRTHIF